MLLKGFCRSTEIVLMESDHERQNSSQNCYFFKQSFKKFGGARVSGLGSSTPLTLSPTRLNPENNYNYRDSWQYLQTVLCLHQATTSIVLTSKEVCQVHEKYNCCDQSYMQGTVVLPALRDVIIFLQCQSDCPIERQNGILVVVVLKKILTTLVENVQ